VLTDCTFYHSKCIHREVVFCAFRHGSSVALRAIRASPIRFQRDPVLGSKLLCGSDCREDIAHHHRRQGIALQDRFCEGKNPFTQVEY
jgi:hypothetical protein